MTKNYDVRLTDAEVLRQRINRNFEPGDEKLVDILRGLPDDSLTRIHGMLTNDSSIERDRNEQISAARTRAARDRDQ